MLRIVYRYDVSQLRDMAGRWSDGTPGPAGEFDLSGLVDVIEIEGAFGSLALGVDDVGDVRIAFREHGQIREFDLSADEVADMADALDEVAAERDQLPADAADTGVYYDATFGGDDAHRVELYGSGVIGVAFGYSDPDPYQLMLDPPADGEDDVAVFTGAIDEVLQKDTVDAVDPAQQRSYSPENGAKAAPAGGQFAAGGGRIGAKGKQPTNRRPRAARPAAPAGPLSFDGKHGTGYGVKGGDPRVRTLQAALTRLGVNDSDGHPLAPDGKYGPKTTSAVKKLQRALGLKPDGQVTPELLKQATELKQLPPSPTPATPRRRRAANPARRSHLLATVNRALRMGVEVRHQQLFDRAFALDDIQISRSGDGRTVEAYAACFDQPYEVRDQHGHYMEVIDRAAFNRTLAGGAGRNAMCLYNHGMSVVDGKPDPMAQIPIGTPLEIKADGRGLLTVTRYNKSPYADEILEAIRNGAIRSQSFRGRIVRSSPDRVPLRTRSGALPTITRHELGLTDYGPTPIPVNAGAEIMAVRSVTELVQDLAALDDDGRLEVLRTLGIDLDGDEAEDDEASEQDDDTTTSAKSEPGAEDSPLSRHSGRQIDIQRRIRAAMISRGMK